MQVLLCSFVDVIERDKPNSNIITTLRYTYKGFGN